MLSGVKRRVATQWARVLHRPRPVVEELRGMWWWETSPPPQHLGAEVAVIACWLPTPRVRRSVRELARQLSDNGFTVILSVATEFTDRLVWDEPLPARTFVLRKPNYGYDFGSWAVAFDAVPRIFEVDRVLVANDSQLGPFASIEPMLRSFRECRADYWGATRTMQYAAHLQSFMMGFSSKVLRSRTFRRFWAGVRAQADKTQVIHKYELGLSGLLSAEGFVGSPMIEGVRVARDGMNPMIFGWQEMMELGYPFVKREIVRSPQVMATARQAPAYLKETYGVDVKEWM